MRSDFQHLAEPRRGRRAAPKWLLVGHGMGAKIASVVTARALGGETGLSGLQGVVLLAGSPPSPEPMDEERRCTTMSWVKHGPKDDSSARKFIADNAGAGHLLPLDRPAAIAQAVKRFWLGDVTDCKSPSRGSG